MSSSYGEMLKLTIFGESHSPAIGVTLEGLPAGFEIDMDKLNAFLSRRAPGKDPTATQRREGDIPRFLSGLVGNKTCGSPLCAIIENTDVRSSDYDDLSDCPRPGHADYTAFVKYKGHAAHSGGGHFSGRLCAPLCIAGGIALQLLDRAGIFIGAHIVRIGKETASPWDSVHLSKNHMTILDSFPVCSSEEEVRLRREIMEAKACGDSVGGIIECAAVGVPCGIGDPMFLGMESRIAKLVFGVPAVKGLEFGSGMDCASMRGSESNDPFIIKDNKISLSSNNAGGILGGISDGMPIIFRAAIKPTPSIAKEQNSVSISSMTEKKLTIHGRHDPCIVPRAVPIMEASLAIALLDALLADGCSIPI